jgi:hypothetical protein
MRYGSCVIVALASLAFTGRSAEAKGEASFFVGRSFVGELRLEDQTSFGGTVGVFSRIVGFEFGVDFMPTSSFEIPGVELGASVLDVAGNVVLQAPLGEFVPYGTVGYGALFANASGDLDTDEFLGTYGAFNYGFGAKMFFTDNVGLRVDYRRYAIQTDEDDPSLEIPGISVSTEPDVSRFVVGLALRW